MGRYAEMPHLSVGGEDLKRDNFGGRDGMLRLPESEALADEGRRLWSGEPVGSTKERSQSCKHVRITARSCGSVESNQKAIRRQSEGNRKAIGRHSEGNQKAIRRQSEGNRKAIGRHSEGNQKAIRRQSEGNQKAIRRQSEGNQKAPASPSRGLARPPPLRASPARWPRRLS